MIPATRARLGFWGRLAQLFRRPRLIQRCAVCGCALDNGQWLPSLPKEREVCGGNFNFAMPGEPEWRRCLRMMRRLG